ncbi:MAG: ThiF family adenylyltransferase [Armatimonadetes bacterium]|nr:ThiF family adenylyltransferase [Armatimonadota bacterium]
MEPQLIDRYARQKLVPGVGEEGQSRLLAARVAVVGCGATGSLIASLLTRAGVGTLRVLDRDFVDWTNLHRQVLYSEEDVTAGRPKAVAAVERLRRVNSDITIEPFVVDLNAANVEEHVGAVDLVMDGTDNFETRFILNDACVKAGKPWVYCGAIASQGMVMPVLPGEGPCLRCLLPEPPPAGMAATCDTVGVLGPVVGVAASVAAGEGLKILLGAGAASPPGLVHIDLWENEYHRFTIARRPGCPACGRGEFPYLVAAAVSHTTTLCGRNAVQITVTRSVRLDLKTLAAQLRPLGEVTLTPFLLRAALDGHRLTIFPDARAIIEGTTDEAAARSLYARYVGA